MENVTAQPLDQNARIEQLGQALPLTGVAFAALTLAGFLLMGKNPEPDTPIATVKNYWSTHHSHVLTAGTILAYGAVLFAIFTLAVWARIRREALHPAVAGGALLGGAVTTAGLLASAGTYYTLGDIANAPTTLPAALQALHLSGTELSLPIAGGVELLLLAVAVAGLARRAFPRWLAWTALPIGILQLTPIGFQAFLLFMLWTAAAGIAMTVRPATPTRPPRN
ncbi:MAG: hypothetical protein H0X39_04570 [Actinobacteria bacterium]|nr:hypothetical protein [Actinomycetota bacterium]